ncbi:peroxisomal membrane protein 2 isoform X1 [Lemur catta]|uniref:peroxisomal membrane protein 2 isoform X1 n=1 Tax=Lemur catta TaxID=9447 RepID=UPI001E269775|nr:peroxisomal membrane protein 2 isoform X1 [Lemur catta]
MGRKLLGAKDPGQERLWSTRDQKEARSRLRENIFSRRPMYTCVVRTQGCQGDRGQGMKLDQGRARPENHSRLTPTAGPQLLLHRATESLLLPLPGALDPSGGSLGGSQEAPPGTPPRGPGLPAAVLPHHELSAGAGRGGRGACALLAGAEDELEGLDAHAVHQHQLHPAAVPGAFCQPGGSVLVRLPGLSGEVRMARENMRCTVDGAWGSLTCPERTEPTPSGL